LATPADPLAGAALYADVKTYAQLGEHRTGGPGDTATTAWLARALKAAGYAVTRQAFDYDVFEPTRADLALDGRVIEGFPYWTPRTAPPGGITGPLTTSPKPGAILLVRLPPGAGNGLYAPPPQAIVAAASSGVAAVVVVTENPLGELVALNRTPKAPPWPVPVLIVAGREGPSLMAAAGRSATLRLEGHGARRTAHNVIGERPGAGKRLVISTPKSGWFRCAGERGSGVAIWLGLARWLASTPAPVTVVAASGHEFDGYGGGLFTETLAPNPAQTRLWLHLGANIAAYDFGLENGRIVRRANVRTDRVLACSETLLTAGRQAFVGQPGYSAPLDIDTTKPVGELAHFHELGYAPLAGVVAGHPLHHTRRDLADVTAPDVLEPVARGLRGLMGATL
jgi:hypothetical protein